MSLITKLRNILDARLLEGDFIYPNSYWGTTGDGHISGCLMGHCAGRRLNAGLVFQIDGNGLHINSWNISAAFNLGIAPVQARALEIGFMDADVKDIRPDLHPYYDMGRQLRNEYMFTEVRQYNLRALGEALRVNDESTHALAA